MYSFTGFLEHILSRRQSGRLPVYPAGTVDTSSLCRRILQLSEELDSRFEADIDAYRETALSGFYRYGYSPDFSVQNSVDLYLIRQGFVYALEYFLLYRIALNALLSERIPKADAHVFGCGSMIDALGLCNARDTFSEKPEISYTGIDPVLWTTRFDADVEQSLVLSGMQDYWKENKTFDGNILLFAKVFNELREGSGDIESFCEGLRETDLTQDTILLCPSYRNRRNFQNDWQETDWCRMQKIIAVLLEKGYSFRPIELPAELAECPHFVCGDALADDGTAWPFYYLETDNNDLPIADFAPDFTPPESLAEYLNTPGNIRRRCSHYADREKKYLRIHPEMRPETAAAETVCSECCPIRCRPQVRLAFGRGAEMCFQVLMFQKIIQTDAELNRYTKNE